MMRATRKPTCSSCNTKESNIWRKGNNGSIYCSSCAKKELDGVEEMTGNESNGKNGLKELSHFMLGPVRKSSRIKPARHKYQPALKTINTKGKGRRAVFKKNPVKAPTAVATVITTDYVFHDGHYWQTGDLASVMDEDGGIYYVQIRGFLQDQYCEKSVVITWLIPTTASIPGKFDPSSYIIGPEEDLPRHLSCFEFIMHAPSDYFYDKSTPYRTQSKSSDLGFIYTHLGPEIRRVPPPEQIYGLKDLESDDSEPARERTKKPAEKKKAPVGRKRKNAKGFKGIQKVPSDPQIKQEVVPPPAGGVDKRGRGRESRGRGKRKMAESF